MDKYLGKRLDGRYEIREIIGVGGMAVVYKAYDNVENRFVAIKILKEEFLSNQEFLRRFKNESKAIAMFSHPNIVNVYDVSFGDLIQYIVMEYIEGITLKEFIEREGSLRWKDAVHFTIQILKGLQHAHDKGIVHRDVKPQNIMVLSDGTIKVTDFGIARFARSDQRTITDKAIGSVHYISPEQARGEKTDEKTDLYSVGVMLYEMLTGKLPFQAESAVSVAIMQLQRDPMLPSKINGSIPQGLEQITMHAMQKSQERRYQSASEMLCDLTNFRKDPAITFPYSYFVDDAPTKFVNEIDVSKDTPTSDTVVETTKKLNSMVPILTGVAVAVVIALIVLGVIFGKKLFTNTGKEFDCPNFVGMTREEIEKDRDLNDKFIFVFKEESNAEYAVGEVFEQSIEKGKKLKKGTKITLKVSVGEKLIQVPDVTDNPEATAISTLEAAGFKCNRLQVPNEEIAIGNVINTIPKSGEMKPEGSTIDVYISTGKEQVMVDIPSVYGEPVSQARDRLELVGLTANVVYVNITPVDNYQPKDNVLRQDPPGGSDKVPEGTAITLYVSSGMFETDIEITLPTTFPTPTCSIWLCRDADVNSAPIEGSVSTSITLANIQKYTFNDITSTTKTATFYVMIKDEGGTVRNYQTITVNFELEKGNVTVIETATFSAGDASTEPQEPTDVIPE